MRKKKLAHFVEKFKFLPTPKAPNLEFTLEKSGVGGFIFG